MPMESSFIDALEDHLNAEIVAGTVATVREAVVWLSYTYVSKTPSLRVQLTRIQIFVVESARSLRQRPIWILPTFISFCI